MYFRVKLVDGQIQKSPRNSQHSTKKTILMEPIRKLNTNIFINT